MSDTVILTISVVAALGAALLANILSAALQERYRRLQDLGPRALVIGIAGLAVLILLVSTLEPRNGGSETQNELESAGSSPDSTVRAFWAASQSLNCEEATNLISDEMFDEHGSTRQQAIAECNADTSSPTWEPRADLTEATILSESADASVVVAKGRGWVQEISLIREGREWRIKAFGEIVRT
jgi:hypothetical protein